nr:unnamed protein product [Spirometra erinaceieuropaei]
MRKMKKLSLTFLLHLMLALSDEAYYLASNGLEDNVITSTDNCIWASVKLPEKLTNIAVDERSLSCDEKLCRTMRDNYLELKYQQESVGSHYLVSTYICEPENYFIVGYEMETFRDSSRTARITQYLAPKGHWPETQIGCIVPQLSMPLVRNVTEGATVTVQCAISKERSYGFEDVVIFDLNQVFCENNETVHTCVGNHYLVKAKICEPENVFVIGYEIEKLRTHRRTTRITQYLVPNENWSVEEKGCISPQYTMPLIRNLTEGSETIVQCAISKERSNNLEEVVIFDLNTVFCEYNDTVRTCERRELDEDTVLFSTTVFRTEPNEYYPDQYVFCNAMGSYMSIRITWDGEYPGDTCICED